MGLAYYSTMIGLNVILTCLILGRILYLGRAVSITARKKCMARYTGTISMIVESALPYALSGIAWLVSYGIGSEISILFLSFYIMFTVSMLLRYGNILFIPAAVHFSANDHFASCQGASLVEEEGCGISARVADHTINYRTR